jgi:hypothetical protein
MPILTAHRDMGKNLPALRTEVMRGRCKEVFLSDIADNEDRIYTCEVCGAKAAALRRGRCWVCYVRWADGRPAGAGASCVVCDERRQENLRMVELQGSWTPMCHNCATKSFRLSPMPRTVEGIKQQLSRDRRWADRRKGRPDHRIFAVERRNDERREELRDVEWLDAEDLIIESFEVDEPKPPAEDVRIGAQSSEAGEASPGST